MRDRARERAADALGKVNTLPDEPAFRSRYRSYVDRLGGAVVMNGLGQALATELAASDANAQEVDKQAHAALARNVSGWLTRSNGVYPGATDVMQAIMSSDQDAYLLAQAETLAWLTWHKKFCHASLPKGTDE